MDKNHLSYNDIIELKERDAESLVNILTIIRAFHKKDLISDYEGVFEAIEAIARDEEDRFSELQKRHWKMSKQLKASNDEKSISSAQATLIRSFNQPEITYCGTCKDTIRADMMYCDECF